MTKSEAGDDLPETNFNDNNTNSEREKWSHKIEYLLSMVGFCVGLGNIWRFPYICMRNGGGAFLIPFVFFLVTCGLPLYFLEVSVGQFMGRGVISVWNAFPLFRGIGFGTLLLSAIITFYYNIITTWNQVLQMSSGIDDIGTLPWHLPVCFLTAWIMICLCLIKGVRSIGKVVYVTATMPYIILAVLFIRGVTLPGGVDGIIYYLKPNFTRLLDKQVWLEAALQVFYSLGPCWGGLITMSSYNKDAISLTFISEGT
ncbi:hypothetical protein KUTeg_004636, partial [Tegillarca granosa]